MDAPDVELFHGRLDRERLGQLFAVLLPVGTVDEWYLCGPFGMVTGAEDLLRERGVDSHHIHHEIFHVDDEGGAPEPRVVVDDSAPPAAVVTISYAASGVGPMSSTWRSISERTATCIGTGDANSFVRRIPAI